MANPGDEVARLHVSITADGSEKVAANLDQVKGAAAGAANELNKVADASTRE